MHEKDVWKLVLSNIKIHIGSDRIVRQDNLS